MMRLTLPLFVFGSLVLPVSAGAVPGGEIGTLPLGYYTCALPGDATGPAFIHVPTADFTIVNSSSYEAAGARGTYLLTGDIAVMTSGPFDGKRFVRQSRGSLAPLGADGKEEPMDCVLGPPPDPDRQVNCPEPDGE